MDSNSPSAAQCEDCGLAFPLREAAGKCPKCVKLQNHDRDSAEYQDIQVCVYPVLAIPFNFDMIQKWPQCSFCGVTKRNMAPPPVPGSAQTCGSSTCNLVLSRTFLATYLISITLFSFV